MEADKTVLTVEELHELAQRYLGRLDAHLEEEKKQRRPGRVMSRRQQELEATIEREDRQYTKEGLGKHFPKASLVSLDMLTLHLMQ